MGGRPRRSIRWVLRDVLGVYRRPAECLPSHRQPDVPGADAGCQRERRHGRLHGRPALALVGIADIADLDPAVAPTPTDAALRPRDGKGAVRVEGERS